MQPPLLHPLSMTPIPLRCGHHIWRLPKGKSLEILFFRLSTHKGGAAGVLADHVPLEERLHLEAEGAVGALELLDGVLTQHVDVELVLARLAQPRELLAAVGAEDLAAALAVGGAHVRLGPVSREDGLAEEAPEAVGRAVEADEVRAAVGLPPLPPLLLRSEEAPVGEVVLPRRRRPQELPARRAHHEPRRRPVEQDRFQEGVHFGHDLPFHDRHSVRLFGVDVAHFDQDLQISDKRLSPLARSGRTTSGSRNVTICVAKYQSCNSILSN